MTEKTKPEDKIYDGKVVKEGLKKAYLKGYSEGYKEGVKDKK